MAYKMTFLTSIEEMYSQMDENYGFKASKLRLVPLQQKSGEIKSARSCVPLVAGDQRSSADHPCPLLTQEGKQSGKRRMAKILYEVKQNQNSASFLFI